MLVRLLYASRAVGNLCKDSANAIMAEAQTHNPQKGVTGVLCYSGGVFMQVLEGSRDSVNNLYAHILRDPRHREVILLHYEEITERRFSSWTMGQVNLAKLNTSVLLKYSDLPELNPYTTSGKAAMALIEELIASASVVNRV